MVTHTGEGMFLEVTYALYPKGPEYQLPKISSDPLYARTRYEKQ